jgi:hypothetical protein
VEGALSMVMNMIAIVLYAPCPCLGVLNVVVNHREGRQKHSSVWRLEVVESYSGESPRRFHTPQIM